MSDREEFEKWRKSEGYAQFGIEADWEIWQARQPEIDALIKSLSEAVDSGCRLKSERDALNRALITEQTDNINLFNATERLNSKNFSLNQENAALKAEVKRLRQKMDAPCFFLLGISGSPNVPVTFRQAALMHHESLDAAMKETAADLDFKYDIDAADMPGGFQ